MFNGKPYSMEWSLKGESFALADEDGDVMEGTLSGGTITGRYAGYDYVRFAVNAKAPPTSLKPGMERFHTRSDKSVTSRLLGSALKSGVDLMFGII